MSQISLPFRILLGAMLVFTAIWFSVLRPKTAETPQTAPGVTGLARDADAAKSAVDKTNTSAAATDAAAKAVDSGAASATAPATKPAVKPAKPVTPVKKATPGPYDKYIAGAGPAKSLVRALSAGKVVLMVFRSESSDSGAVVQAARTVAARGNGSIRLRVTNIKNVGKYAVFTQAATIAEAPSTLIVGPRNKARVIVGYTTPAEIAEAATKLAPKAHLFGGRTARRSSTATRATKRYCRKHPTAKRCAASRKNKR